VRPITRPRCSGIWSASGKTSAARLFPRPPSAWSIECPERPGISAVLSLRTRHAPPGTERLETTDLSQSHGGQESPVRCCQRKMTHPHPRASIGVCLCQGCVSRGRVRLAIYGAGATCRSWQLPDEKVLDVGSGIGRKTIPPATYLTRQGHYEGMDIVEHAVNWCRKRYARKYPHFRFQHLDAFNKLT